MNYRLFEKRIGSVKPEINNTLMVVMLRKSNNYTVLDNALDPFLLIDAFTIYQSQCLSRFFVLMSACLLDACEEDCSLDCTHHRRTQAITFLQTKQLILCINLSLVSIKKVVGVINTS